MKKAILLGAAAAIVACAMVAFGFLAGTRTAVTTDDRAAVAVSESPNATLDQKAVELIVRDYLLTNPELLVEVQVALDAKQKEEQRIANLGVIRDAKADIFNSPFDGVVGNPAGKVTIVEFYDYNCGYCKRAIEDMRALTSADSDLRFVLKEFPILGPEFAKGPCGLNGLPQADTGEVRRVSQPAPRWPRSRQRGGGHQGRSFAGGR